MFFTFAVSVFRVTPCPLFLYFWKTFLFLCTSQNKWHSFFPTWTALFFYVAEFSFYFDILTPIYRTVHHLALRLVFLFVILFPLGFEGMLCASEHLLWSFFSPHFQSCITRTRTAEIQYLFHVQKWCKACVLLDGLNRGLPKLGIGRSRGSINGCKDRNEKYEGKSIESKQCGTLDF